MTYRNGNSIDRRFLDFHYTMPRSFSFMDLDGVAFCHQCKEPLALVETSRDAQKATTVMRRLADLADLRAYLILVPDTPDTFAGDTPVTIRRIRPNPESRCGTLADWVEIERAIRQQHHKTKHEVDA